MSSKPNNTLSLADAIGYLQYHGPLYQRFSKPHINAQELESIKLSIKTGLNRKFKGWKDLKTKNNKPRRDDEPFKMREESITLRGM